MITKVNRHISETISYLGISIGREHFVDEQVFGAAQPIGHTSQRMGPWVDLNDAIYNGVRVYNVTAHKCDLTNST